MIYSMTAFSRIECAAGQTGIQWEIKSVNHRFLEVQFRLPEQLRDMESELRDLTRACLSRGKVDCTLTIAAGAETGRALINQTELELLFHHIKQIRKTSAKISKPNPLDILRWPGIVSKTSKPSEKLRNVIKKSFNESLEQLLAHRQREGEKLQKIILSKLSDVSETVSQVRKIMEGISANRRTALLKKIAALDVSLNPERLEQEVVILVQRADVMEELDRLDIQVAETQNTLVKPGPHGRRLDFLMQELNREANTLGSKSVLPQTTQKSVDLKVVIEQIREQVQNIE